MKCCSVVWRLVLHVALCAKVEWYKKKMKVSLRCAGTLRRCPSSPQCSFYFFILQAASHITHTLTPARLSIFCRAMKPQEFCLVPRVTQSFPHGWFEVPQREWSFLCSGKTSAPTASTVIPLHQHSMTLFRNINIYTTHMLIKRTSKYSAENVLFRNAAEIFFGWVWLQQSRNSTDDGRERQNYTAV